VVKQAPGAGLWWGLQSWSSYVPQAINRHDSFLYEVSLQIAKVVSNSPKMSSYTLPPVADIPSLPTTDRIALLDALFEPSTSLHTLSLDLLHTQTFSSYNDLIASIGVQLIDLAESASTSDTEWLDKILGAHPRLGAKKVESAQSAAEQAQLNTGGAEEAEKLRALNEEYEKKYPGLRYVYA
jgi:2-oxo-4-hydroxy-4-carboxy--5-ureidoimidazoline (OHCU) decarboxylase